MLTACVPVLLFRAPELEEQLFDARQDMDECVAQALHLDGLISSTSRSDDDVNLRECMDIVMKIVPSANTGAMAAIERAMDEDERLKITMPETVQPSLLEALRGEIE